MLANDGHTRPVGAQRSASAQTPDAIKPKTNSQVIVAASAASAVVPKLQAGAALIVRASTSKRVGGSLAANYVHRGVGNGVSGSSVEVGLMSFDASLDLDLATLEPGRLFMSVGPSVGVLNLGLRGAPLTGPAERLFLAGRAELAMQLKLHDTLFLEVGFGAVVPWLKSRLIRSNVQPVELWKQPDIGGVGRIGLGVTFP
jgi:hypothetical protein